MTHYETMHQLLVDALDPSSNISQADRERLASVRACDKADAWNTFVESVGDDDCAFLQAARTLILCDVYFSSEWTGALFGVNARRTAPDVLYNPNQDENGDATETSYFIERDADLTPNQLRKVLTENKARYRYIQINTRDATQIYVSLYPFVMKMLDSPDPVPSVCYDGIHAMVL